MTRNVYGQYSLAKKPSWEKAHVDRMVRMVLRDRNHPSVIIWSMGNEAGNGVNFFKGYDQMKANDKSKRPVQYERPYKDADNTLYDMDTNYEETPDYIIILVVWDQNQNPEKLQLKTIHWQNIDLGQTLGVKHFYFEHRARVLKKKYLNKPSNSCNLHDHVVL